MLETIVLIQDFAHVNGGNAKVAISEAIALKERGYRVIMFSAVAPIENTLVEKGVEVSCLNIKDSLHEKNIIRAIVNGIWNGHANSKFNEILSSLNPNTTIVHFHCWVKALSASLFAVTAKYNFRIVITLHDFFTICPNGGLFNYPDNNVCRLSPMSVKCQFCNCDSRSRLYKYWRLIRQYLFIRAFNKNQYVYLYSISDITDEKIAKRLSHTVRKTFRVDNPIDINNHGYIDIHHDGYYTAISRISKEKGVDMFCEAMRNLGLKGQVLGDGPMLEYYKEKYPEVLFRGWCNEKEKTEYLKITKCLILTSRWYETFGLVVSEMKSFGIPSIVPDECAASEQIIDGETGFVFESRNQLSLERKIKQFEKCDINKIHHNVIADSKLCCTLNTHIDKVIECYNEILKDEY